MPDGDALAGSLESARQSAPTDGSSSSAVQGCPTEKHWVEVQLVGEDGKGIPNQPCELHLPDGSVARGSTDALGVFGAYGFPGTSPCTASFTELDANVWEAAS